MTTAGFVISVAKRGVYRELALGRLEALGVFMPDGHFDYGNGYHGNSYLNPHALLHQPYLIWQFAQDLIDQIPHAILDGVETVAGPVTGGALLASAMATLIDSNRHPTRARVYFVPFHHGPGGTPSVRRYYGSRMEDQKVLLVDDVLNTGKTLELCAGLIGKSGGELLASAVLFDRMSSKFFLPAPNFPLAKYPLDEGLVAASECPMCKLHIELTKF